MEVCKAVLSLDFIDTQLDFSERMVLILLQVGQGNFEDPSLQSVICILQTCGSVDESFADTTPSVQSIKVLDCDDTSAHTL